MLKFSEMKNRNGNAYTSLGCCILVIAISLDNAFFKFALLGVSMILNIIGLIFSFKNDGTK